MADHCLKQEEHPAPDALHCPAEPAKDSMPPLSGTKLLLPIVADLREEEQGVSSQRHNGRCRAPVVPHQLSRPGVLFSVSQELILQVGERNCAEVVGDLAG